MFDKIISMETRFFETAEVKISSYVVVPLRSNAILNLEKLMNFVSYGHF